MKRAILAVILVMAAGSLWAEYGSKAVGIDASIYNVRDVDASDSVDKANSWSVAPYFAWMQTDVFEIAPYVELGMDRTVDDGSTDTLTVSTGLGSAFYWHLLQTGPFRLISGGTVGFSFEWLADPPVLGNTKDWTLGISLSIPLVFELAFGPRIMMRAGVDVVTFSMEYRQYGTDAFTYKRTTWKLETISPFSGLRIGILYRFDSPARDEKADQ